MTNENYRTPGQLIKALLDERGWTQRLLAIILGVDETGINHVVAGKRPVTAEMAILLAEVFNAPAEKFLELQKEYDLAKARIVARPDPNRATRANLFGGLPVTEMIKRGWLNADDIRNVSKVEESLVKFFGVSSVNEIEILPHAAKKTETFVPATPAQLAWLYRVKKIASEMIVAKYSPSALTTAISLLNNLLTAPEEARKVPRILAECGIRFVIVEALSSSKIDGVCFWLNKQSPVVGISLRYDRIDNFWFVLRHELEHVLQQHGQEIVMLDAELEGDKTGVGADIADEERVANIAASEFCVPQKRIDSFIARKSPLISEKDVLSLSNVLKIHPGLIVGQIQRKTGRYELLRHHLVKIRSFVTPGSMVDGWGDISPVGY